VKGFTNQPTLRLRARQTILGFRDFDRVEVTLTNMTPAALIRSPARAPFAAMTISAAATVAIIIAGKGIPAAVFLSLILVASAAFFLFLRAETRRPTMGVRPIAATIGILLVVAVLVPPRTSNDVWAYSIYGRILSVHHDSPYTHPPYRYKSDPYYRPAEKGYSTLRDVYGPVFTGLAGGIMLVSGRHLLVARLLWQGLAAFALIGALVLLWRRTKDPVALAFLGLNPMVAASIVNGGHNDALVGLGILAGAVAAPSHPLLAGLILGAAASIKVVALIPLGALVLWTWYRKGLRPGVIMAGTGIGTVVAGYLIAGGLATLTPLHRASLLSVRHSIWNRPRHWIIRTLQLSGLDRPTALHRAAGRIAILGMIAVGVITALVILTRFFRDRAEHLAGTSLVPYLFAAPYVLPWYPGWVLPALSAERRRPFAVAATAQSLFLFAVDPDRYFHFHGWGGSIVHVLALVILPLVQGAALFVIVGASLAGLGKRAPSFDAAAEERAA
jgi:glycosyl transferase family 87